MKQIPNIFTLANLFIGVYAIILILQPGLSAIQGNGTDEVAFVNLPEQMVWGSICIGLAAIIDFFDGFIARLFKVPSEMGKQLDSLADVVSFGVAPGLIIFQLLRYSYAKEVDGLSIATFWLMPAFLLPCAGAYRLARFNIDNSNYLGFKGVPIPATGLMIASFPLIAFFSSAEWMINLVTNKWFLYSICIVCSALMVSKLPLLALKFKQFTFKALVPFLIIALITLITAFFIHWMAVPITFAAYIIVSLIFKPATT